jgi:hypothetical protein
MRPPRLILESLLLALCPAFGAEIAFDKAEEFPASAYGLIAEKRVVWFGEMHGTCEAPQLFLGLVRLVATRQPAPPVVALAIPALEQRAIDRYKVQCSPFLGGTWTNVQSAISATPPFNTYTNTTPLGDKAFYRVGLDLP